MLTVILVHRVKSNISIFDGIQKIDATILSRPLDENVHVGVVSLGCSDSAGSSVQHADVSLVFAIGWVAKCPVSLVRFWISISVLENRREQFADEGLFSRSKTR